MERALSPSPGLHLDPKRIAATSVAILVHAAVLMLLLMPTTARQETAVVETTMTMVPTVVLPPPPPPPPPPQEELRQVTHEATHAPVPLQDPPVDPVDAPPSPMDFQMPEIALPPTDFGSLSQASVFAQIAADIAPTPPYPKQAVLRRQAGKVVLRIRVDAQGRPIEVTIESSSGFALLDEAAAKFVKARWHFIPAMQDGKAVEALALLPVDFNLPR